MTLCLRALLILACMLALAHAQDSEHKPILAQKNASNTTSNLVRGFELFTMNYGDKSAPTLLLVGGIHGDEAGAYYATDVFLRHYKITKGSVWVVPVANPHGMFANMRGVYGDMNRKFAALSENDPDYESIQMIKNLLANKDIDISMHLHDGSGYWRPTYHNALFNQHRWGNCSVVDQPRLEGAKYGEIEGFVEQMVADINEHILAPSHRYHVHNTHTKAKNDVEQLKALTFFSLSLGKPALTNEASKELSIPVRVFYHLLAIESLLGQLGIGFERDFNLSPKQLEPLIAPPPFVQIEQNILLPLSALRPHIGYLPMPSKPPKQLMLNSQDDNAITLLGIVKSKNTSTLELKYGSRTLASLMPEWREFDNSLKELEATIDGKSQKLQIGTIAYLKDSVRFTPLWGYRVNIIGFTPPNAQKGADEAGFEVKKKDLLPQYSLDKNANIYRAEIYRGEKFSGMVLLSFEPPKAPQTSQWQKITYTPAPNSPLSKKLALAKKTDSQKPVSESSPKVNPESSAPVKEVSQKPQEPQSTQPPKALSANAIIASPNGVNIRQVPSTTAPIIAKLPQGAKVKVLERGNKWSKIAHSLYFSEGYVISKALSPDSEPISESKPVSKPESTPKSTAPQSSQAPAAATQAPKSTAPAATAAPTQKPSDTTKNDFTPNAKVKVPTAFVRIAPSETSAFIAKAPMGREVQVLEYVGEAKQWAKIYYIFVGKNEVREIRGYIATRLLEPLTPPTSQPRSTPH